MTVAPFACCGEMSPKFYEQPAQEHKVLEAKRRATGSDLDGAVDWSEAGPLDGNGVPMPFAIEERDACLTPRRLQMEQHELPTMPGMKRMGDDKDLLGTDAGECS